MLRSAAHASVLEALADAPLTTAEVAEAAKLTSYYASKALYQLLDHCEVKRVPLRGEVTWALPAYVRVMNPRRKRVVDEDDDSDMAERQSRTPEERRALVAAALADSPLSMTTIANRLRMRGVGPLLLEMRADGEVKKMGRGAQTLWALVGYVEPVIVKAKPTNDRLFSGFISTTAPKREPSWWATPGLSRDAWYAKAHDAGGELVIEAKTKGDAE